MEEKIFSDPKHAFLWRDYNITEKNSDPNQKFGCIQSQILCLFLNKLLVQVSSNWTEGRVDQNIKKETWLKLH